MRLLLLSATYTFADASTATPYGLLNVAVAPDPSENTELADPARVVTKPVGLIMRMRLLLLSATYTFADASTATPLGP